MNLGNFYNNSGRCASRIVVKFRAVASGDVSKFDTKPQNSITSCYKKVITLTNDLRIHGIYTLD